MKHARKGAFLIAQMHQISGRIFSRLLRDHGIHDITPSQGRILFALWRRDDVPIRDLAAMTSLKKSTLTAMLDVLERSGHVTRVPSGEDRRRIHIRLTAKNRELQDVYARVSQEMTSLGYAGFSKAEVDAFEAMLERILANLKSAEVLMEGQRSMPGGGRP